MNSLKISRGYSSLKSQYLESQSKNFPLLGGDTAHTDLLPSNPIVERDSKIKVLKDSLTKATESVQSKDVLIASLEQKQNEETGRLKDLLSTARKKIDSI